MTLLRFLSENARWLGAGVLLTFLSSFGQTFFISIFSGEIRAAFDLSHGAWGGIYTLGTTASAVLMVWAGGLTDRFRVRVLGPVVLVMLAGACLAMASLQMAWLLPVVIFALRFTGQGMASHIAVVAMSRWFIATRGRALSIAGLGFSFGEAVPPLLFVALMIIVDWRFLWVGAAVVAVASIPLLMWMLTHERTPQMMAQSDQSLGMGGQHWTRKETLTHPLFWFMVPALLGPPAFGTAFFFHQVHYAGVKAMDHVDLVAMFPIYTLTSIGAMVAAGWALDRWGTARIIPFMQVPNVLAFVLFAMAGGPWGIVVGIVLMGLTTGANATLPNAFWAEFYGTGHLGAIKAMAAAIMVLGSAIGPGLTGIGIDLGLGIETQYMIVGAYFVMTTILMMIGIGRSRAMLTVTP